MFICYINFFIFLKVLRIVEYNPPRNLFLRAGCNSLLAVIFYEESPRALLSLHVKIKGQQIWCNSKTNG